jgi:hypothetical protein
VPSVRFLADEDIQFRGGATLGARMRQVRMKIEGFDAAQQVKAIDCAFGLYRDGGSIALRRRTQPEAVLHSCAEPRQKRASEPAKALLRRYRPITMMTEVCDLSFQSQVMR